MKVVKPVIRIDKRLFRLRWYEKPFKSLRRAKILRQILRWSKSTEEFNAIIINGRKGRGKSTLALWLAYYVYGDWDLALRHVLFKPEDVIRTLESEKPFTRILVWDDAGVYTGYDPHTYWNSENKKLRKMYELIRTYCPVFVFTHATEKLGPWIRNDATYVVDCFQKGKAAVWEVLRGIKYEDPTDWMKYGKHVENFVFEPVPSEIYEKYEEARQLAAREALEEYREDLEKAKERIIAEEKRRLSGYLTVKELAALLGLKPSAIYTWIYTNKILTKTKKIGGKLFIDAIPAIEELYRAGKIDLETAERLKRKIGKLINA